MIAQRYRQLKKRGDGDQKDEGGLDATRTLTMTAAGSVSGLLYHYWCVVVVDRKP